MRLVLVLLMSSLLLFSCNQNKEIDFHKTSWKPIDTAGYYEYITTKITEDPAVNKKVVLKLVGWLNNDSNKIDSSSIHDPDALASFFKPELSNYDFARSLGANSTGYIKMDFKKYLFVSFKNAIHFTVYFSKDHSFEELQKDSARLSAMKIFKEIDIMSSEKAAKKWEEENDTTWRKFITDNPLPVSLELKLNDPFLQKNKFDSVEHLLENELPGKTQIMTGGIKRILDNEFYKNATLIFKFTIF
ncbi:MAG: permease-like cell division protein FtsX [Ferruginibacter sp.]